jgi:hypothetical protein
MSRYHNPKLSQKVAKNVGKVVKTAVETKKILTHPHEEAMDYLSEKLIKYGKKNTGLKGQTKDRIQVYNTRTKRFVKIDTKKGKILGSSKKPYKRIRRK